MEADKVVDDIQCKLSEANADEQAAMGLLNTAKDAAASVSTTTVEKSSTQ